MFSADSVLRTGQLHLQYISSWTQWNTCAWCATRLLTFLILIAGENKTTLKKVPSELWFSWDQKSFFWVFRWKQMIFAFRITSNKTKLPVSLSEFQFVFTAARCSYIFITCFKRASEGTQGINRKFWMYVDKFFILRIAEILAYWCPLEVETCSSWKGICFHYKRLCWLFYSCYLMYENTTLYPLLKLYNCCLLREDIKDRYCVHL